MFAAAVALATVSIPSDADAQHRRHGAHRGHGHHYHAPPRTTHRHYHHERRYSPPPRYYYPPPCRLVVNGVCVRR